jgi:hypothetical protein
MPASVKERGVVDEDLRVREHGLDALLEADLESLDEGGAPITN